MNILMRLAPKIILHHSSNHDLVKRIFKDDPTYGKKSGKQDAIPNGR